MRSSAHSSAALFPVTRMINVREEKMEKMLDNEYLTKLKIIALHPDIAGTVAGRRVTTIPSQVRINDQDIVIKEEKIEQILFPTQQKIEECKTTRELMEIFATPFKCYLQRQQEIINDSVDAFIPQPIALFIKYWQQIRINNLPLLNDQDNRIKIGLEKIEQSLYQPFFDAIAVEVPEEKIINRCAELIAQGAPINIANDTHSPLSKAASLGLVKVVEKLLAWGARIEPLEKNLTSAIVIAACNGHTEVVRILLKAHLQDHSERSKTAVESALEQAIKNKNLEMVKLFNSYFCDHASYLSNLISVALSCGAVEIAKYLMSVTGVSYLDNTNNWKISDDTTINSLLEIFGIEKINQIRIKTDEGDVTLFFHALDGRYISAAKVLLDAKADVSVGRHDGMMPFMLAAKENYAELIGPCLDSKQCNINQADINGYTALMHAIKKDCNPDRLKSINELIKLGADPDIIVRPTNLVTEDKEVKAKLPTQDKTKIEINAFMLEFNKSWPVKFTKKRWSDGLNFDVLKTLYAAMDKEFVIKLLWQVMQEKQTDKLCVFVELLGCEKISTMQNDLKETPLMMTLRLGHYKFAEALLNFRIKVDAEVNKQGDTALVHFVREANKAACQFLIENNADVNLHKELIGKIAADKNLPRDFLELLQLNNRTGCAIM
jgi:ankyrin repeat protein